METEKTANDGLRQLQGYRKPVYIAGADAKATEAALEATKGTTVGVINEQGKVVFGATVELINIDTDEEVVYQIVGELESDIKAGLLSIRSPTARALIGKEAGDLATVEAPGGERQYEVVSIKYV